MYRHRKVAVLKHFEKDTRMTLHTFGEGKRQEICSEIIASSPITEKYDTVILLPIPSTRDKIHVTGTKVPLCDLLKLKNGKTLIIGYGIPLTLAKDFIGAGIELSDVLCDEEFLRENAELTAHGAAGVILTENKNDVSDMKIGIIGYGRIGKILSRILLFLGAKTVIFTRSAQTRLELWGVGIEAASSEEISKYSDMDILINTAPAKLLSEADAAVLCEGGCKLIELASGEQLPDVQGKLKLPSIPDKMYPVSAGKIYAKAILRSIGGVL